MRAPFAAMMSLALPLVLGCVSAPPGEDAFGQEWSLTLDASYNTKYIWRGIERVDEHVFQPSAEITHMGVTAGVWANMDLTDSDRHPGHGDTAWEFTEIDYHLAHTVDVQDEVSLTLGAIRYEFPNTDLDATTEIYGSAGLNAIFSPKVTVYYDVDEAQGFYATLAANHSLFSLEPWPGTTLSMDAELSIGYADADFARFHYGHGEPGFADARARLSLPIRRGPWYLTPNVSYSRLLDSDIRDATEQPDNLSAGLSVGYAF